MWAPEWKPVQQLQSRTKQRHRWAKLRKRMKLLSKLLSKPLGFKLQSVHSFTWTLTENKKTIPFPIQSYDHALMCKLWSVWGDLTPYEVAYLVATVLQGRSLGVWIWLQMNSGNGILSSWQTAKYQNPGVRRWFSWVEVELPLSCLLKMFAKDRDRSYGKCFYVIDASSTGLLHSCNHLY